ncbi:DNA-binding transcriptional regulator [Parasutterella muris]|jgi:Predicted transcriptional regulator|nr:helix-turn-helix domain-containing protein [Parasutterella muris]
MSEMKYSSDIEVNRFAEDLLLSVKQMKARKAERRTFVIPVVETRNKTGLTQEKFAQLLGVSVKTLAAWEQGVRTPSGAARTLLKIAEKYPKIVKEAASA